MKKYIINLLFVFALVAMTTSCGKDWLELELKGSLPFSSEAIDTDEKAFEVLCGAYDFLQVKYYSGWSSYYMLSNLASDDGVPVGGGFSDRPEYWDFHEYEITSENPAILQLWRRNYYGIYRANIVLNDITLQSPAMDLYRAEAKFLRAYYYSELVKNFGNIAFYTVNLSPSEYRPANTAPEVVYAQIEKDLLDAIEVLPNKSQQSRAELTRASKGAAQALLGKVYLFQEKFDEAASVLKTLVESGEYDLCPVYDSIFKRSEEYGIESVFEIPYMSYVHGDYWANGRESEGNIEVQLAGPRETALTGITNAGWGFDMIDSSLIDAWDAAGDVIRKYGTGFGPESYHEFVKLGPTQVDANGNGFPDDKEKEEWTGWYQKKRCPYVGYNDPGQSPMEATYENNERIIRFADVLLMYAEALNRKNSPDDARAIEQVNRVRERAKLTALSGLTGDALFESIKLERRLELAMEGQRYWDVVRWGDGKKIFGPLGFIEGTHEVWPIPEAEIGKTSLVQNPGY
ncbi:MAG TPA: RagB/SusD family nutrient uptake outer membrane protein [Prolixibacteraceae bacterium]|nr:RagB/SusD family nutrient uptake outer membrane protein [Prolixibacteraceae bacterium]